MKEEQIVSELSILADAVSANPALLSVLDRLGIRLGFHEATIKDVCNKYGLSALLLTDICNIYICKDYKPRTEVLSKQDTRRLIGYLKTSHRYYSQKSFPELHSKIHRLLKEGDQSNAKILNKFYDDYDEEINRHFIFEEETVFPFLEDLLEGKTALVNPFNLGRFEENHTNIEEKLSDLRNTILKYLPDGYSHPLRIEILKDIYSIEKDLEKHTEIEDKLLVPAIRQLLEDPEKEEENTPEENRDDLPQSTLSDREKEIIAEVAKGLTNKEIADKLNISIHTVTTHRKNISRKTGINSISGITVYAIINKLVDLNDLKY